MKDKRRYKQVSDGDLLFPSMWDEGGHRMACCDCGLVHDHFYAVYRVAKRVSGAKASLVRDKRYVVGLVPFRNARATAGKRKGNKA